MQWIQYNELNRMKPMPLTPHAATIRRVQYNAWSGMKTMPLTRLQCSECNAMRAMEWRQRRSRGHNTANTIHQCRAQYSTANTIQWVQSNEYNTMNTLKWIQYNTPCGACITIRLTADTIQCALRRVQYRTVNTIQWVQHNTRQYTIHWLQYNTVQYIE